LRGATHQFVAYQRKDGVKLSGTLYLPPGYKPGQRLPLIMWAYPREFGDPDSASQITGVAQPLYHRQRLLASVPAVIGLCGSR